LFWRSFGCLLFWRSFGCLLFWRSFGCGFWRSFGCALCGRCSESTLINPMKPLRLPLPPSPAILALLLAAYALPGLFGHDPWKPEDAIGMGVVHQMLAHGQWWVPHLAGEPFLEDGPLQYWVAALFSRLTSFALSADDGARLASAASLIACAVLLRRTAVELWGAAQGTGALLVLLGCLGLMVHAHEILGEMGLLAGHALAWYGIVLARRRAFEGGAALGLGLAIAVLSKGLLAPLAPLVVAIVLPLVSSDWRNRGYAKALASAFAFLAIPLSLWWALAVAKALPASGAWFSGQLALITAPTPERTFACVKTLAWTAWPAWPIALWHLWERRRTSRSPGIVFGVSALAAAILGILLQPEAREVHALAALLPFALLAGAGVERLRRGAANALAWFGAISFAVLGGFIWFGWVAMMTGAPERMARNFTRLEPGFVPQFQWAALATAIALTAGWIWVIARSEHSPYRSVLWWACGTCLFWGLAMTLWLPWVDYGKTYRPVAESLAAGLKRALPAGASCIESRNLGESQRAALDYHAGIVTRRAEIDAGGRHASRCPALLVQGRPGEDDRVGAGWRRVWEGSRPRDRERYRLYIRR